MTKFITDYHAKYYAHELTKQASGNSVERLSTSLFDASVDLNPHQIEAALFALRSPLSKGVVLADEVGLGKTIEAGLVLCQYWAERKRNLLVICPASLRRQWANELSDKFNLPCLILDSSTVNQLRKNGIYNPFEQQKIIIVSYQYAFRMEEQLVSVSWNLVTIDEAHKLRNAHLKTNRIGQSLRRSLFDRQKLLLTATPLQNSLIELYGLSTLIDENLFGDDKSFRAQYLNTGSDLGELKARLGSFMKRTLRKQVLEYVRYTERKTFTQPFTPSDNEQHFYDLLSAFMLREDSYSLPKKQRHLTNLILRKLLASSTHAVTATLEHIQKRLEALKNNSTQETAEEFIQALIEEDELEDDYLESLDNDIEENVNIELNDNAFDIKKLDQEITELGSYIKDAQSIKIDAKTEQLISALQIGFREMGKMDAPRKAIIFTESRRTQEYLKDYLVSKGYGEKITIFNGTNNDSESAIIYKNWLEQNKNTDKVTGSKPVDKRTALIENFRDNSEIMIATEAAAEGVNLQFCSLVINYDLPWNPQRIEQRIGRCHRYGQKFDVVVINFVNTRNSADQRVLELLTTKFNLFNGVFGASDDVLGAIESGVDFEKRILEIYQSCRSTEEINSAFDSLQNELKTDIEEKLKKTQELLLTHFDEDIHDLMKLQLDQAQARLDRVGRLFWDITLHQLANNAKFDSSEYQFFLEKSPISDAPTGHYQLISKTHANATTGHVYRLTHPLGEYVLEQAVSTITPTAEIHFNISQHATKISMIEKLKGASGWLILDLLKITAFQTEEHLVFTGLSDSGETLDQEVCEKLFNCYASQEAKIIAEGSNSKLQANSQLHCQAVINRVSEANNQFFNAEREKLEKWADDKILASEQALQDTKNKLRNLNRLAGQVETIEQQNETQIQIQELEQLKRKQRRQIFDVEDQITEKRDELINALKQKINQHTQSQRLFTIRWLVV
jgi:superfamily II DNA/RNA helicase